MEDAADKSTRTWYRDGLRFSCLQCGNCCKGAPAAVWVTDKEVETLAAAKNLDLREFRDRYVHRILWKQSLVVDLGIGCRMLTGDSCSAYSARPIQCRTWPFWPRNLKSEKTWRKAGRRCPGIDSGKLHSADDIEQILLSYGSEK